MKNTTIEQRFYFKGDAMNPLVSFLIAAYNEEKFIVDCVESCLNQSYPHIEVCITDDGSTDNTWRLLSKRYQADRRVVLDRFEKNKGKVPAFNRSYENASGEYFALVGADDVSLPDRIEASLNSLKRSKADLVFARMKICDRNLKPLPVGQVIVKDHKATLERILTDNFCYGSTLLFNHRIAEHSFPIPEALKFEDWWIGFNAHLNGKTKFVDKFVTLCRQHEKNTISNPDEKLLIQTLKKDFLRHFEYYKYFYRKIQGAPRIQRKDKYFKIIRLNYTFRKMFYLSNLRQRLIYLPYLLRDRVISPIFFYSIGLLLFGTRIYRFKQLAVYKKIFKNI